MTLILNRLTVKLNKAVQFFWFRWCQFATLASGQFISYKDSILLKRKSQQSDAAPNIEFLSNSNIVFNIPVMFRSVFSMYALLGGICRVPPSLCSMRQKKPQNAVISHKELFPRTRQTIILQQLVWPPRGPEVTLAVGFTILFFNNLREQSLQTKTPNVSQFVSTCHFDFFFSFLEKFLKLLFLDGCRVCFQSGAFQFRGF